MNVVAIFLRDFLKMAINIGQTIYNLLCNIPGGKRVMNETVHVVQDTLMEFGVQYGKQYLKKQRWTWYRDKLLRRKSTRSSAIAKIFDSLTTNLSKNMLVV